MYPSFISDGRRLTVKRSEMRDPVLLDFQEVELLLLLYHHMLVERRSQTQKPITMTMGMKTTTGEPSEYHWRQSSP